MVLFFQRFLEICMLQHLLRLLRWHRACCFNSVVKSFTFSDVKKFTTLRIQKKILFFLYEKDSLHVIWYLTRHIFYHSIMISLWVLKPDELINMVSRISFLAAENSFRKSKRLQLNSRCCILWSSFEQNFVFYNLFLNMNNHPLRWNTLLSWNMDEIQFGVVITLLA